MPVFFSVGSVACWPMLIEQNRISRRRWLFFSAGVLALEEAAFPRPSVRQQGSPDHLPIGGQIYRGQLFRTNTETPATTAAVALFLVNEQRPSGQPLALAKQNIQIREERPMGSARVGRSTRRIVVICQHLRPHRPFSMFGRLFLFLRSRVIRQGLFAIFSAFVFYQVCDDCVLYAQLLVLHVLAFLESSGSRRP